MENKWKVCKINSLANIMSSYINYYQKQYRKHNRERIRQLKQELYDLYKSEYIPCAFCHILLIIVIIYTGAVLTSVKANHTVVYRIYITVKHVHKVIYSMISLTWLAFSCFPLQLRKRKNKHAFHTYSPYNYCNYCNHYIKTIF